MAHALYLTSNSVTVNLYEVASSYCYLLSEWVPRAPTPGATFVEDVIPLNVTTTTMDAVRAKVNAIELALLNGQQYTVSRGFAGHQCYLYIQPDATGTVYQAEVFDGWCEWDAGDMAGRWAAKDVGIKVHVRRAPYWESVGGTLLVTSNQTTTPASSAVIYLPCPTYTADMAFAATTPGTITDAANGLAIFKTGDVIQVVDSAANDGTYTVSTGNVDGTIRTTEATAFEAAGSCTIIGPVQNWVQVAAAQATNFLPCPVWLELYNGTNDADELTTIWAGHNAHNNPSTLTPATYTFEAEDATATNASGGMADTEDAACSGGYYCTATEAGDSEAAAYRFDLVADTVDLFKGGRYRIIARMRAGTAIPAAYVRAAVTFPGATFTTNDICTTDTTLLDTTDIYQDMGELYIPPWLRRSDFAQRAVSLTFYAKKTGGWAWAVDFFMAISMDSFCTYEPLTGGVEYQEELLDKRGYGNPLAIYTTTSAGTYDARGAPLILYPGQINRYYFLALSDGGEIGRTATVEIKAKIRRAVL